jgi:hypothetical protein
MYEVVEAAGEWIVRRGDLEVARFSAQSAALREVAERLRHEADPDAAASFSMRFSTRS